MIKNKENIYVFILALIQFCHILDFVIMMPLGPLLMREFGISATEFSVLISSYSFSAAPAALLSGIFIDLFDRKKYVSISLLLFIITTFLCSVMTSFNGLLLMRICAGACGGVLTATILAMLTDLVSIERRGQATSTVFAAFSLASILGIPLGLLIADRFSYKWTFVFISIIACFTFVLIQKFIPSLKDHLNGESKNIFKNYKRVCLTKKYWPAFFLPTTASFSAYLIIPFISTYLGLNLGCSETDLGTIFFVAGFFTVVSMKVVGKLCDIYGSKIVYYFVACISFIPVYIYTNLTTKNLILIVLISSFFQMFVAGRFIPCMTIATKVPTQNDRGAFMSIMHALRSFFSGLAALVAGFIISTSEITGQLEGFHYTGYISIFFTIVSFYIMKKTSDLLA